MGCTGVKQAKSCMCSSKKSDYIVSNMQKEEASQVISLILDITKNIEILFSNILVSNPQIPEEYSLLHPSELLQKLRESEYLNESQIDKIELEFNQQFQKLSQIMNYATLMLFDCEKSKYVSEENKNFLLQSIMLYEKTCQKYIDYQNQRNLEKSIKGSNSKIMFSQILQSSNQESRNTNQLNCFK